MSNSPKSILKNPNNTKEAISKKVTILPMPSTYKYEMSLGEREEKKESAKEISSNNHISQEESAAFKKNSENAGIKNWQLFLQQVKERNVPLGEIKAVQDGITERINALLLIYKPYLPKDETLKKLYPDTTLKEATMLHMEDEFKPDITRQRDLEEALKSLKNQKITTHNMQKTAAITPSYTPHMLPNKSKQR